MCMTGMVMVLPLRRFTNGMAQGDLAAALAINDTQRHSAYTGVDVCSDDSTDQQLSHITPDSTNRHGESAPAIR